MDILKLTKYILLFSQHCLQTILVCHLDYYFSLNYVFFLPLAEGVGTHCGLGNSLRRSPQGSLLRFGQDIAYITGKVFKMKHCGEKLEQFVVLATEPRACACQSALL